MISPGWLLTHRYVLERVWGLSDLKTDYVRVHLVNIRKKLEPDPSHRGSSSPALGERFDGKGQVHTPGQAAGPPRRSAGDGPSFVTNPKVQAHHLKVGASNLPRHYEVRR